MSRHQRDVVLKGFAATQAKAETNLAVAQSVISQDYLCRLGDYEMLPLQSAEAEGFNLAGDVRIFRIRRLVQENRQAVLESATAAYTALGVKGASVFFYLHSSGRETWLYIGVHGAPGEMSGEAYGELLEEVFKGHFPGSRLEKQSGDATRNIASEIRGLGTMENQGSVTAVTGVPALSSEDRSLYIQGLERFIDAAEGKAYQAIILADPISPEELRVTRAACEHLATLITPLAKTTTAYNQSQSRSVAESLTNAINESFSETETKGTSYSENEGENESVTTESMGRSVARGGLKLAGNVAGAVGMAALPAGGALAGLLGGIGGPGRGALDIAGGFGLGEFAASFVPKKDVTKGTNRGWTTGTNESTATGKTHGTSRSEGETTTHGSNQGITHTIEQQNKSVEQLLSVIDYRLERIGEARSYGGWNAAAYFVAETPAISEALASLFTGIMRGASSGEDNHVITTWHGEQARLPREWLSRFHHPRMSVNALVGAGQSAAGWVTPAVMLSGRETAMLLNLPRRSASTLPVLEAEPFGRSIPRMDGKTSASLHGSRRRSAEEIQLGPIRHLWEDLPQKISFDREQLKTHAFVTGTTGSGKSNTLYLMLHQLLKEKIPFLVIEPAKGEYAKVFGGYEQVGCFDAGTGNGTGLKINPFRCPPSLHLLEHIDRLTGIFCVCWPLYAAMPALLKDAVIVAYERAGWDVENSIYLGDGSLSYPDFSILLNALEDVIAGADYGERLQAEYTGALCTRVRSLMSGINGQIFTTDELGDEILFDQTALVDLSRIGSAETKSLIMGMLVMRLVEYRQAQGEMNAPLRHVTVLEEAHNLLRASTTQDSGEQGNMGAKSVEMLTDAIAEMRTYGEGFMIVDQSPQAVHRAAIRNTATKIALRLPDEEDRRALGSSIGLNDEQIREMARLENGVAVVHQSGWLEAVLCHMDRFDEAEDGKAFEGQQKKKFSGPEAKSFRASAIKLLLLPFLEGGSPSDLSGLARQAEAWPVRRIGKQVLQYVQQYEDKAASKFGGKPLSQGERMERVRLIADVSGLRRQVALLASRKQSPADLTEGLLLLVRRHLGALRVEIMQKLLMLLLEDWAGLNNVKRSEVVRGWNEYVFQSPGKTVRQGVDQ